MVAVVGLLSGAEGVAGDVEEESAVVVHGQRVWEEQSILVVEGYYTRRDFALEVVGFDAGIGGIGQALAVV